MKSQIPMIPDVEAMRARDAIDEHAARFARDHHHAAERVRHLEAQLREAKATLSRYDRMQAGFAAGGVDERTISGDQTDGPAGHAVEVGSRLQ